MRIYAPNQLIRAVEQIAREHPLAGEPMAAISSDVLEKLVRRIDCCLPENLHIIAKTLTKRQCQSLCVYLPENIYHVNLSKIKTVLSSRIDSPCFWVLFRQWQKYPNCEECLSLLGEHDTEQYRPENFPVQIGLLKKWASASQPLLAIVHTVVDLGEGHNFIEKLSSLGIGSDTYLAVLCHWHFLCHANAEHFTAESDSGIVSSIQDLNIDQQSSVLKQLLTCGSANYNFLIQFPKCYRLAYNIWGNPHEQKLTESSLLQTYTWWYNYYQLSETLHGDKRRINFWKEFLDRCECTRVVKHEMLVMRFGNRVVTEFETMGAVYIFTDEYYDSVVGPRISTCNATQIFKSWLFNHANYLSRETHMQNWESNQYDALKQYHVI